MLNILFGTLRAVIGAILDRLFPFKTAADQRAADLSATTKEAEHAAETTEIVGRESDNDLDADLAKRVRTRGD